jgi:hypothetical protein
MINKDPGKRHFMLSMIKSHMRIIGCLTALITGSITGFVILFALAEIVGIAEEV